MEEAVEALHAGVAVGRGPAPEDTFEVLLEGIERLSDRLQDGFVVDAFMGMADEAGDPPAGGPDGLGLAYPTQLFLDPPRCCREEVGGLEFGQRRRLLLREPAVGGLEHGPAQRLGHAGLLGFGLAHLIDRAGEELNDMEPVHRHRGALEGLADGGQEGGRHVAHDLDDTARLAAMGDEEVAETGEAGLALAGGDEDHWLLLGIEIDEHGDVVVAALGCRLVEAERLQAGEIEPGHGLPDIVLDDAPQPLVGDANDARGGEDWHLARQDHRRLLEQEREPAALARPRHLDPLDPMLGTIGARHLGRDVAMVLEEIQMAPGEGVEIMRLARPGAIRAGEPRATVRRHFDVQFLRPLVGGQSLAYQLPRRRQPKAQAKNIVRIHRPSLRRRFSAPKGTLSRCQKHRRFHLERRGALSFSSPSFSSFNTHLPLTLTTRAKPWPTVGTPVWSGPTRS